MALSSRTKLAICILYTPLFIDAVAYWIFGTVYYKEQWECYSCYADYEASPFVQIFLLNSYWSMWLTIAVFGTWAAASNYPAIRTTAERILRVALPHVCTVMLTYVFYNMTLPQDSYLDLEKCHAFKTISRNALSKQLVADQNALANLFLVVALICDVTIHYLSAPLLLLLLFSGELEYDSVVPYSTIFVIVLGAAIGLFQTFSNSRVYCGDIWFGVGMFVVINLFFHTVFVLWHRQIPSCLCGYCCSPKTKRTEENKDEEMGNDIPKVDDTMETVPVDSTLNLPKDEDATETSC